MSIKKSLIQALSKHFPMHPSRLKTFEAIILAAISSGNCQQFSLSRMVDSPNTSSALRRIERFFQKQALNCYCLARFFVTILHHTCMFDLCLDRTNWNFGTKKINYLVLSWRVSKELSLPLFFTELDKAGNSHTTERITLLNDFITVFGSTCIKSLKADREFIGEEWIQYLCKHQIPFFIRVRHNMHIPYDKETSHTLSYFYDHLKGNQIRTLFKEMYGHSVCFVGKKIKNDDEYLIVLTNKTHLKAEKVLKEYRARWSIEEMFRKLKTSGFNIENTHMTDSDRLVKLLIILAIALLCAYLMGMELKRKYKKTTRCYEKTIFRLGLQHFQHMISKSMNETLTHFAEILDNLQQIMKSDG